MPIWSVSKGVVWSFHGGKLYTATARSGEGHRTLHVHNSLPVDGPAFDAIQRGRALITKKYKVIEVVSLGRHEHLQNAAHDAILKHFGLPKDTEVLVLEPGWDNEPVMGFVEQKP
jgi:hypothetical protein